MPKAKAPPPPPPTKFKCLPAEAGGLRCCPQLMKFGNCKGLATGECSTEKYWHPTFTKPGVCLWFQRDDQWCCAKGKNCKFEHVVIGEEDATELKSSIIAAGQKKKKAERGRSPSPANAATRVCKYFAANDCRQGMKCPFRHPGAGRAHDGAAD